MAKTYLGNAFSLNMVNVEHFALIRAKKVSLNLLPEEAVSIVGHPDTARVLSTMLGREIPANRVSVTLHPGDVLYVAQYKGPRLEEGATKLPEGASFEFFEISVRQGCEAINCNSCTQIGWLHGN